MSPDRVAFVAMSPALNIIYNLERFQLGVLNRSTDPPRECPNGKAVTSAKIFKILGGDPVAVFPSGGARGRSLEESLQYLSIRTKAFEVGAEIRRNYVFLAKDKEQIIETQLLEPGPRLSPQELDDFLVMVTEVCAAEEFCVISGSLPDGVPTSFYSRLIGEIRLRTNIAVALDTSGAALVQALSSSPQLLKINREEFLCMLGTSSKLSEAELLLEMERVGRQNKIDYVIVTRGKASVLAWSREEGMAEAFVPAVDAVNTVGSGDCFLAGFLFNLDQGLEASLRMGVALGAANVLSIIPGEIDLQTALQLKAEVCVIHRYLS